MSNFLDSDVSIGGTAALSVITNRSIAGNTLPEIDPHQGRSKFSVWVSAILVFDLDQCGRLNGFLEFHFSEGRRWNRKLKSMD